MKQFNHPCMFCERFTSYGLRLQVQRPFPEKPFYCRACFNEFVDVGGRKRYVINWKRQQGFFEMGMWGSQDQPVQYYGQTPGFLYSPHPKPTSSDGGSTIQVTAFSNAMANQGTSQESGASGGMSVPLVYIPVYRYPQDFAVASSSSAVATPTSTLNGQTTDEGTAQEQFSQASSSEQTKPIYSPNVSGNYAAHNFGGAPTYRAQFMPLPYPGQAMQTTYTGQFMTSAYQGGGQFVSPAPFNGQGMAPAPFNGQVMAPVPFNGKAMGPVPLNGQVMGPVPFNGKAMGPAPLNGQVMGPVPFNGKGMAPAPFNGQAMGPVPFNGQAMVPAYGGQPVATPNYSGPPMIPAYNGPTVNGAPMAYNGPPVVTAYTGKPLAQFYSGQPLTQFYTLQPSNTQASGRQASSSSSSPQAFNRQPKRQSFNGQSTRSASKPRQSTVQDYRAAQPVPPAPPMYPGRQSITTDFHAGQPVNNPGEQALRPRLHVFPMRYMNTSSHPVMFLVQAVGLSPEVIVTSAMIELKAQTPSRVPIPCVLGSLAVTRNRDTQVFQGHFHATLETGWYQLQARLVLPLTSTNRGRFQVLKDEINVKVTRYYPSDGSEVPCHHIQVGGTPPGAGRGFVRGGSLTYNNGTTRTYRPNNGNEPRAMFEVRGDSRGNPGQNMNQRRGADGNMNCRFCMDGQNFGPKRGRSHKYE